MPGVAGRRQRGLWFVRASPVPTTSSSTPSRSFEPQASGSPLLTTCLLYTSPDLATLIATEGDAALLLAARHQDGHWGRGFYQPKWTSSHYTLLELRNLELPHEHPAARETVQLILRETGSDGGVNPSASIAHSDACVNGMFLDYASWFGATYADLAGVLDFLLDQRMPDGGYNCRRNLSLIHI